MCAETINQNYRPNVYLWYGQLLGYMIQHVSTEMQQASPIAQCFDKISNSAIYRVFVPRKLTSPIIVLSFILQDFFYLVPHSS